MDGTEGVTQCPILPGDTFIYRFLVDRVSVFTCNFTYKYKPKFTVINSNLVQHFLMTCQPGTYIYHAHYVMQRSAGLNGMIVVKVPEGFKEPFTYDREYNILLNDWWHNSTYDQAAGLLMPGNKFKFVGEPQVCLNHFGVKHVILQN